MRKKNHIQVRSLHLQVFTMLRDPMCVFYMHYFAFILRGPSIIDHTYYLSRYGKRCQVKVRVDRTLQIRSGLPVNYIHSRKKKYGLS